MKAGTILFLVLTPIILFGQSHKILKDIAPGSGDGIESYNHATFWNGKSYFICTPTPSQYTRIWSTDGTTAHTVQVLTEDYPSINFLTSIDNGLIFDSWKDSNPAIYKSNGTQSGTSKIVDFPSQEVGFMQRLNNTRIIFITENFAGDSTFLWSTDGTATGTINLGYFEIKLDYLTVNNYKNSLVFSERSTNGTLFPPVITDGTIAGTGLVKDFINDVIPGAVNDIETAVGTTDFLFVQTNNQGKIFDGHTLSNFNLTSDYIYGFNLGHLNIVMSYYNIMVYDSIDGSSKQLPVEPYFFTEAVSNGEKVFFLNSASYVYETDGTSAGTKKIGSKTAGSTNFSPYLFANKTQVIYDSELTSNTELWKIDLTSGIDSLFSVVKPANNPVLTPYVFSTGDYLIYSKYTAANGRELWVYEGLPTGTHDIIPDPRISISPNPADQELTISFGNVIPVNTELYIFNTVGQIVSKSAIDSDQLTIDVSDFNSGVYFLQLNNGGKKQYSGSFVKK